ncbi:MerR family DNA-binding transcriptional regulator [Xenophilus sp.]|uniref:MerR family DNA-binding transcriptional regulator n=1 Tax=Xenophilus sp. TaxID=1873499 RepID=UPI0037DCE638
MRISELARRSGVSANRLRRYEAQGLLKARRLDSGYREFAEGTEREAIFIAMSRDLGFTLARIAEVLPRYRSGRLTVADMEALMRERIAEVDAEIATRRALRRRLVSHIAWLREREARRAAAAPAPRNAFTQARRPRR